MEVKTIKDNTMKTYYSIMCMLFLLMFFPAGCSDEPVDEDGLLITPRAECYVSTFDLLGSDYQTVCVSQPNLTNGIDTVNCTIDVQVHFGTDLKNLFPQFSLVPDAKLEPKITGFTDFSDLANPRKYTVISGNRKVRKEYMVRITVQQ